MSCGTIRPGGGSDTQHRGPQQERSSRSTPAVGFSCGFSAGTTVSSTNNQVLVASYLESHIVFNLVALNFNLRLSCQSLQFAVTIFCPPFHHFSLCSISFLISVCPTRWGRWGQNLGSFRIRAKVLFFGFWFFSFGEVFITLFRKILHFNKLNI